MEKEPGCVRTGEMQNRLEEPTESDEALSTTKICKIVGFGVCAQKTRELDVMRVWFLRAFVVFFLDFVMFSQSFQKQFAQSQDPNLSCPGVASTQPPLVSNEIARIQPQAQCSFHPHWKFHFPMLSSYMPISLFHWIS